MATAYIGGAPARPALDGGPTINARPAQITRTAPAPVAPVYPQPRPPVSPVVAGRPLGPASLPVPIFRPVTRPIVPNPPATPPASPISGNPVQTSILQPTHTTSTIIEQAAYGYQEPTPSFSTAPAPVALPEFSTGKNIVGAEGTTSGTTSQAPGSTFLGFDQSTLLILLVLFAIILAVS
jgi:hypothetical protein